MKPVSTFPALDHVIGGGLHPGQVVLLSGLPGSRKTTLALSVANCFAGKVAPALHASGEQTKKDLDMFAGLVLPKRSKRLYTSGDGFSSGIKQLLREKVKLIVVDTLHSFMVNGLKGAPGSPSQMLAVTRSIMAHCKSTGMNAVVIAHANRKDLSICGPAEHYVDTVLFIEPFIEEIDGTLKDLGLNPKLDPRRLRVLVARKNRYGSTEAKSYLYTENDGRLVWVKPRK